jgi:hypothetical protein
MCLQVAAGVLFLHQHFKHLGSRKYVHKPVKEWLEISHLIASD